MTLLHDEFRATKTTLEHELADLLRAAKVEGRQARAVAARLGWDGDGSCTLAAAAATEGYSRERVRQLEARVREYVEQAETHLPAVETALRLIEEAAPLSARDAAAHLASAGVSNYPFDVSGLLSAAEIVGIDHRLQQQAGMIVRHGAGRYVLRQEAA